MNKYLLYRISSRVNAKPRIAGFSKLVCLDNLLAAFPDYRMICLADNCDAETLALLRAKGFFRLEETRLGQTASFYHLVNMAIETLQDEDIVYFIEDDYLHLPGAGQVLEEGLDVFDYVTLYDHPDKYGVFGKGRNPYVDEGKLSEATRVFKGALALWRTTNSTTHTFACHVKTLKEDRLVWTGRLKLRPRLQDFYDWIFLTRPGFHGGRLKAKLLLRQAMARLATLAGFKKRTLGVPIPSVSAHLEAHFLPDGFDIQRFQTNPTS